MWNPNWLKSGKVDLDFKSEIRGCVFYYKVCKQIVSALSEMNKIKTMSTVSSFYDLGCQLALCTIFNVLIENETNHCLADKDIHTYIFYKYINIRDAQYK